MKSVTARIAIRAVRALAFASVACVAQPAFAVTGEMGTGIPRFGTYSAASGAKITVWGLDNASTPMVAGCTSLTLSVATMGIDAYKLALGQLTTALAMRKRVRFYAHADRDGGCGVDYFELQN